MIHFPVSFREDVIDAKYKSEMEHVSLEETWAAMENLVDLGLVKNIGVSNMNIYEMNLIMNVAKKPIAVN